MEAVQARTEIGNGVKEVTDRAAFAALQPRWDALVGTTADEPFYRHAFLRAWIDNFAPTEKLRVLTARDADGGLNAALPLLEQERSLYGMPVRELSSTSNAHSCRFDLIARDPASAGKQFFLHLAADRSWDVLRLSDVPEGGNAYHLYQE